MILYIGRYTKSKSRNRNMYLAKQLLEKKGHHTKILSIFLFLLRGSNPVEPYPCTVLTLWGTSKSNLG